MPPKQITTGQLLSVLAIIAAVAFGYQLMSKPKAATPTTTTSETQTPAAAWRLSVTSMTGSTRSSVGGPIEAHVTVTNSGSQTNPGTRLQFSDLDKYADLVGCRPKCEFTNLLGVYTDLPGVPPGQSVTFDVEWIAKSVGAPSWTLCVYDAVTSGDQVDCGTLTTVIGT